MLGLTNPCQLVAGNYLLTTFLCKGSLSQIFDYVDSFVQKLQDLCDTVSKLQVCAMVRVLCYYTVGPAKLIITSY